MNFFAELKRRHIYRVAAAYAVVAWVLLQLVNNVAPVLDLPPWVARSFLLLLVIGFPVAILFAWMHRLSSTDGALAPAAGRLDWALLGGLVLVIALLSYQQLTPTNGVRTAQQQSDVAPTTTTSITTHGISIAVLPFVNLSGDPGQEFFSDGMTEEITAALAKVQGLRVLGRTSAFEFKGQNRDLRMIGQALGASHLIEGSVRKAGNRVRITAQLVKVDDDSHLWAENYDRDLTDVFAIQEDIATAIATSLRVPLGLSQGETLVRSRTKDDSNYENYLRARALIRARGYNRLVEASQLLEQVVTREPDFAPAWALLGLDYNVLPLFQPAFLSGAVEQARPIMLASVPKAEAAAMRAIQLDSKSSDGYTALALVQFVRGNYSKAFELYQRALALDADNPDALHGYSENLGNLGYLKQALPIRQRLQELEPLVPIFTQFTAHFLWMTGQTETALAMLQNTPGNGFYLSTVYAAEGQYSQAADVLQKTPAGIYLPGTLDAAIRLLRTAPTPAASTQTLPPFGILSVAVYPSVGASERVLDFWEEIRKMGIESAVTYIFWSPPYKSVRKTKRFKDYVRAAGFVEYWKTKGWPDLCHPVGVDDFVCD